MKINYARLVEGLTRDDPGDRAKAAAGIREAMKDRRLRENFDLGRLFEATFGWHEFRACRFREKTANQVMEAAGAVSTAAFQNITQQFAYTTFLEAYNAPELVFSQLIPTQPTPFRSERVPGISNIGDEVEVVQEGKDYPIAGVSENWIETPDTLKRGLIIPATWEAFFFDRTGQLRDRISQVGAWRGVNREKRAIDCIIDAGETATNKYRYRWRGTTIATYGDNSGDHTWDNLVASNPFTDYANLNASFLAFKALKDPYTNEPLDIMPKDLLVPPALLANVPFVVGGMLKKVNPGYATSGVPVSTEAENPMTRILGSLRPLSSQLFKERLSSDTTWFLGDIARAFRYMENLAPEVTTAPAGSEAEFTQDVVFRIKVREMGTYATFEPRAMQKNTA